MKELSVEQKAKAYDEALEKARKELQACGSNNCDAARQIFRFFPELKESEDEKIRKAIVKFFELQDDNTTYSFIPKKNILAWLEKQGEQKTYSWKPTKEQFEALDYAYNSCPDTEKGNYYEGVLETLIEDLHRLEKQSEKKPTWSEEDEKKLSDILAILRGGENCYYNSPILMDWLKSLKERIGG